MAMIPCGKGHFYNSDETTACPFCGVEVKIGGTKPIDDLAGGQSGTLDERPRDRPGKTGRDGGNAKDGETIGYWPPLLGGIDPVVGWLVCIAGPDRGRDYRIHTERNRIGRAPTMDIAITGDQGISRDHPAAVVSYNPKRHTFLLIPGNSRGIVYLNDEELVAATELHPYDRIELGTTQLLFVPFCGERFTWPVVTDPTGHSPPGAAAA